MTDWVISMIGDSEIVPTVAGITFITLLIWGLDLITSLIKGILNNANSR